LKTKALRQIAFVCALLSGSICVADTYQDRLGKASLHLGGLLGAYTGLYYIRLDLSEPDHELNQSGQGEYSDWTDFSYDTNYRYFNWGHTYTGASYHQMARINKLDFFHGLIFSHLGSIVWEYGIEYREVFSIGDQILTGFGGSSLGEAMFQIAPLLRRQKDWAWASYLFDPFAAIGSARDIRYQTPVYGNFDIQVGYSQRAYGNEIFQTLSLGFESVRDRIAQRETSNYVAYASLNARIDNTSGSIDFATVADIAFKGVVERSTRTRRHQLLVGLASGIEFETRLYNANQDWFGAVNLLGVSSLVRNRFGIFDYRIQLGAYYDFAMIDALALEQLDNYIDLFDIRVVTSTLGYYYAFGWTARADLILEVGDWSLSYRGSLHRYDSIDKYNRFEEIQLRYYNYNDDISRHEFKLQYQFSRLGIGLKNTIIKRYGYIDSYDDIYFYVEEEKTERQFTLFLNYVIK